jgi:hypothetical protein
MNCTFAPTRWFLKFHHLFIRELWTIVDKAKAVIGVAVGTQCRLSNAASVYFHSSCVCTDNALEESLSHLWHDVWCSNHHATDSNKLINICQQMKCITLFTKHRTSQSATKYYFTETKWLIYFDYLMTVSTTEVTQHQIKWKSNHEFLCKEMAIP